MVRLLGDRVPGFEYASWTEIHSGLINLAIRILSEGLTFDAVVAIAKGGYIPARIVSDLLGIENIGVITVKFYKKAGVKMAKPIIIHPLTIRVDGMRVLIVDDVVDSGRTMQLVVEEVMRHGASMVKTLALYVKPWSTFKPDYYIRETTKWVVFPWELIEVYNEMGKSIFNKINIVEDQVYSRVLELIELYESRRK